MAGRDHPNREPARRLMASTRVGRYGACASTEVLQEILYRYSSLGQLTLARDVYDAFAEICPTVFSVTLADTDRARDLLGAAAGISARDAVYGAVMLNHEIEWVATFDAGFDRVPGVRRLRLASRH
ncbi:MAG TPA: type II toxin-antitoxin system VapC family toxin [Bryobacteraceae bacterium]|nr:type II toxin-antitoxin system VapC family toxin [Bryobacteraceae bacterium]